MDHLDTPSITNGDEIKIAYVCLEPYDNGPFMEYPLRRGYDIADASECDFHRSDPDYGKVWDDVPIVQSFLQAWLFFGLLWEVHQMAEVHFDQSDFISREDFANGSIRRLNTAELPERLLLWQKRFLDLSLEDMEQRIRQFDACLQMAYKVCYQLGQRRQTFIDEHLLLSFMSLGNSLENAMSRIFWDCRGKDLGDNERNELPAWIPTHRAWDAPQVLFQNMARRGWCPLELTMLRENLQTNEIIYASQMPRVGDRQRHQLCRADACTANNIDQGTYRTKHATECSGCKEVVLDYDTICSTIKAGRTPLIVSVQTDEGMKFAITSDEAVPNAQNPRTGKLPYVCISHVWSHGLGNVHRNSLPQCQLEMLHKFTAPVLSDGGLPFSVFWIDTICVPVDPKDSSLRHLTIANMASIYQNALCVVVLDESLMRTAIHATNPSSKAPTFKLDDLIDQRELTIRVIFSDWWRRLWTLQEGVLCQSFFVVFAEGPVQFQRAVVARAADHARNLAHASSPVVENMLLNLVARAHAPGSAEFRQQVLTLLCHRSTSRAADEPVCLATLLGVDAGEILKIPGTQHSHRMKRLWELLGKVPAPIAFLPGPKLEVDGFRWAPETLISNQGPGMLFSMVSVWDEGEGTVTSEGLHLRATGYRLTSLGASLKSNFYILPGDPGELYDDEEVPRIFDGTAAAERAVTAVVKGLRGETKAFEAVAEVDLLDPVLIMANNRRLDVHQTHAILASNPVLVDGRWHTRFLLSVHCYTNSITMFSQRDRGNGTIRARLREERQAVEQGRRTGMVAWKRDSEPIREWCIA